jgi:hypothetical protein
VGNGVLVVYQATNDGPVLTVILSTIILRVNISVMQTLAVNCSIKWENVGNIFPLRL